MSQTKPKPSNIQSYYIETEIGDAISSNFTSPNECDRNLEPANVVDGLYEIARAIRKLAEVLEKKTT